MNTLLRLFGLKTAATVDSVSQWNWQAAETVSSGLLYGVLAAGLALALINFLPQIRMRITVRVRTCLLRLGMLAVLVVALHQGTAHLDLRVQQKQRWLVLVDDSASMATRDVGERTRFAAARGDAERIRQAVGTAVDLEIKSLSGAPLDESPGRGPTLIRKAIVQQVLPMADVRRLALLTDGRDTEGWDFTTPGRDLAARGVDLAIALYGTPSAVRDQSVTAEPERRVLRLGEDLVIRGAVAGEPAGEVQLELRAGGKVVRPAELSIGDDRRFVLTHRPQKAGRHLYTVALKGEDALAENNTVSFLVQVVESKIKVLLLEGFPRFEFKFLRTILDVDPFVDLVSVCYIPGGGLYVQGEPRHSNPEEGLISSQAELFKYDVVIVRDVPRQRFRAGGDLSESRLRNLAAFVQKRGGGLIVLGGEDAYRAGGYENSVLREVLPFDLGDHFSKDPQFPGKFFVSVPKASHGHPALQIFANPARNRERLNGLRELDGSNNVGRFKPLATPLMTRLVGIPDGTGEPIEREVPILAYQAMGDGKVVAGAVDTLWRWQLQPEFEDPPLQALLANLVRYVAPDPMHKPGTPTVSLADASPQVGQEVLLSSLLKDKNYDPIRNADLRVTVTAPDGGERLIWPRDLPEDPGLYQYRVLIDQPGQYTVRAQFDKETQETSFFAGAAGGEYADLSPDRASMAAFAEAAKGTVVRSVDAWLQTVDTSPSTRPETHDLAVWNSPAMVLLFLLLVCADCYVRKRQGLA